MSAKILLLVLSVTMQLVWSDNTPPYKNANPTRRTTFPSTLFNQISTRNDKTNLIISPFSIQTALTLLYMGAEGETSNELQTALQYTSPNKLENAENISQILNSKSDGLVQLNIANRIFTSYELAPKFNEIALKYFQSEAVMVDFSDSVKTIGAINSWVEEKTNDKIKDLLGPGSVDGATTAIIVNAIYFKAKWLDQFSNATTKKQPFWLSATKSNDVDTMFGAINCKHGEFPELDATAIELKYEDDDMALLVILPNQRDGLKALEGKLANVDLTLLAANMKEDEIRVYLPKFKIEFDIQLIPDLEEIGIKKAFSDGADLSGLFKSKVPVKVSDVVHKAYIDVNENGSEAAAATYAQVTFSSGTFNTDPIVFKADHPFVFAIKNTKAVYFLGHLVTL